MVTWSKQARRHLRAVFNHIAKDSPKQAKIVTDKIGAKVTGLDELPRIGKIVAELSAPNVREIHIYSYRILYEIQAEDVEILAIIHKRRDMKPGDVGRG